MTFKNNASNAIEVNEYEVTVGGLKFVSTENTDLSRSGNSIDLPAQLTSALYTRRIDPGESENHQNRVNLEYLYVEDPSTATFGATADSAVYSFSNEKVNIECLGGKNELGTVDTGSAVDIPAPAHVTLGPS
ncbi:hypothetical protein [Pengzhenrongella sp.]|uniref:hypothetical protein n=1 Tax=Pengzhenrongella sp. TaxID=2888820 RepID=UPI002F950ADB